jgi:hypothetical protein
MELAIRLEARTGWAEVTTYEIGVVHRGLHDFTTEGGGLTLVAAKTLLVELRQRFDPSQTRHTSQSLPQENRALWRGDQPVQSRTGEIGAMRGNAGRLVGAAVLIGMSFSAA